MNALWQVGFAPKIVKAAPSLYSSLPLFVHRHPSPLGVVASLLALSRMLDGRTVANVKAESRLREAEK